MSSETTFVASGPIAAPHAHGGARVAWVMAKVMLALTPATLFGFWLYGWPAVHLWAITVGFALFGEAFCLRLMGRRALPVLLDGSVVLTGWLLALSLPPWAPWWLGALGGLFATVIAKQIFGGLGHNLFNPAMIARVALLISFPVPMTQWIGPLPLGSLGAPDFVQGLQITLAGIPDLDAVASASLLGHTKTELARGLDLVQALGAAPALSFVGVRAGSLGETSARLIAAGGVGGLFMRVVDWHIPVAMLLGIALPAVVAHAIDPARHLAASAHLLSGAALLGAFFIATDYVTSPNTRLGQLVFGLGCGLLTWLIRTYGGYPEGVAFAVLLMNALTPAIDHVIRPRIYGRDRRGRAREPQP
jgi:RnfABCDGE-type electron transport complex D subunit